MGLTLSRLSVIILIPLAGLFLKSLELSPEQFWNILSSRRTLNALRVSFGLAFAAACVNLVMGSIIVWALVRYRFPGRRLFDAIVDVPFALPTAVAGVALTALFAEKGWLGAPLAALGIKVAFTPVGIFVALLIFQVDLFSARGDLPTSLLEAAEREKDIRYSSRTRMNTDKNKQLHNARRAMRDLIGKLPDYLKNDPSVEFLAKVSRESTVTVVHLIYRSKNYESSSKDYDFSHVAMVEHWEAGVNDVHLSMRHKDWLERPQSGETMVTYDLTGDVSAPPAKRSE